MGVGICIVGVGIMVGVAYDNQKVEITYLLGGLILFGLGQLLQRNKKS
jgi:hypothetical protein